MKACLFLGFIVTFEVFQLCLSLHTQFLQLGVSALVKELLETDKNGAPLLFHAASSRTKTTCLQTVLDVLSDVLATGGAKDQLEASDRKGRNIMMHAARGNHLDVFKKVTDLYRRTVGDKLWPETVARIDHTGRSVLHHAAQAGSFSVLKEVVALASVRNNQFYREMDGADKNGMTPVMHVLRNKYPDCEGEDDLDSKFEILWRESYTSRYDHWMVQRPVLPRDQSLPNGTVATTELVHAARGGLDALRLALTKTQVVQFWRGVTNSNVVELDKALAVKVVRNYDHGGAAKGKSTGKDVLQTFWLEDDEEVFLPRLRPWGWGMLLAAAAKGGHIEVLEQVVLAIKVVSITVDVSA